MKVKKTLLVVLSFVVCVCSAFGADIHFAGDSTLAPRAVDSQPQSWGEKLRSRLSDGCQIHNYAISGTSTVTFQSTWNSKLIGKVKEGDFVFIQFGHNDPWHTEPKYAKPGVPDRFCTPDQYEANLRKFIADVRAKKGIPILLSPTPSRKFSQDGVWEGPGARHQPYFDRLPIIAQSEKVDFIDMNTFVGAVVKTLGVEASKELYVVKYNGKDNTHPSESGARMLAELFLVNVRSRKLPVAACFK